MKNKCLKMMQGYCFAGVKNEKLQFACIKTQDFASIEIPVNVE